MAILGWDAEGPRSSRADVSPVAGEASKGVADG